MQLAPARFIGPSDVKICEDDESNERHLIVGDEEGNLRVLVQDSDYLRDHLQRKLIEIGILD